MPNSLLTGVSGLLAHQRRLDIVANNLANINTVAFKSQRGVFSDLFYETIQPATNGSDTNVGGTNPNQIGTGVRAAQITRKFTQGNLEATGQPFDFAISGDGFFVLSDGQSDVHSRAGAFSLDEAGNLVDPATGYRVRRFGTIGEGDGVNPPFQDPNSDTIVVPLGLTIPGEPTGEISLERNLDSRVLGPSQQVLTSATPFEASGVAATPATLLNDLDSNDVDFVAGDSLEIQGLDSAGNPISTTLAVDGTTTLSDLLNAINGLTPAATAAIDADGNLTITADNIGESFLNLTIEDTIGNAGNIDFVDHRLLQTTQGTDGESFEGTFEVFDAQGGAHNITFSFRKAADNTWELSFTLPPADGTLTNAVKTGIVFNDDGSISQTALANPMITAVFNGIGGTQDMDISIEGLTQFATDFDVDPRQNGFSPSKLVSVQANADGLLQGVTTNGRRFPVAQMAISIFRNTHGLSALGNNYFADTLNSGSPAIGAATTGGRGQISGGQLEGSNVDVALEFTQLIVAQRGFSANARTISVASEILEELTNIIR